MSRRRAALTIVLVVYLVATFCWSMYEFSKTVPEIHMPSFLTYLIGTTALSFTSMLLYFMEGRD
jgi:hypothetical protein